jgi:exonuclease SbcC
MFGKLFGFRKDKRAATPAAGTKARASPAAAMPAAPPSAKAQEPSLLLQLTQGQAIETIGDTELLHQLVKHSDKLDKKTNRQVRERLQVLKAEEKARQQQCEQQEKLCTRLETLARLQHHPLFDSELAHLQQQWQALATTDTDLASRAQAALAACERVQQEAAEAKAQAMAAAEQAAREAAARDDLQRQQAAQREAAQQTQAAQQAVQQQKQQQSQAEREQQARQQQETSRTLQQQLQQLESAIEQADSKKARELLDRARDNLKKLDAKHAHEFDGKLHLLAGQLRELQDWQAFAALPKLEALCAAMEKLADTDLPPLQKADSVRELQNQWRAMKPPTGKQAQALWDRFKQAGDKAWEPCAAHFEQERQQRAFNLQQRQAICEALEQFHAAQDWDKADWKAVARILDKAKQEFHDFHPVERGEEKGIRARFDAALGAVNGKLLAEQQANEEKKRQLVEAASSVAQMADLDKAAERVRQLQEQWKQVGITRRREDQLLWEAFQQQTGAVFSRRRENHQHQRQAEQEQADRARQACEQIASLARLPDAELAQSGGEFDRLQAEYKALVATLHEKQQLALKKAFHTACDSYRQQLAGIGQRQHALQLAELARRAALCAQLEADASASHVAALQEQWQQLGLPADWERAIDARRQRALQAAQGGESLDHAGNEERLRELCIALEILLDVETPEEDRQRRRDYQMRRLQQGLGQAAGNRREQGEALQVQWHTTGSAAAGVHSRLQARFDAAQAGAAKSRS